MIARIIVLLLLALVPSCAEAADVLVVPLDKKLLEVEFELAKTEQLYAIIDLKAKVVLVKLKGILLESYPVKDVKIMGDYLGLQRDVLEEKISFKQLERPEIKPGVTKSEDVKALELADMPENYSFRTQESAVISVFSQTSEKGLARFKHHPFTWSVLTPLEVLQHVWKKERFTAIRLLMEPLDAQSFYWHYAEGSEFLIVSP